ncbi:pantoate--beta-alanine ligase [Shewanella donghaensis]|uniref:pantoate--beta-alanine ligase n=1 Tax=Shewanella donghaensis TaxID=238836 RepID=UPI00118404CA|nr:pantoate--beta-alanine ligase [Shewanella donghaensis]
MITTANIADIRKQVKQWHMQGETVAFVPTMGNLHSGHITLVTEALKRAHHVVVSIFVNPMQFGQNEDLDAYPRTLQDDADALVNAGAELLFTPTPDIIYPKGLDKQTFVEVPKIGEEFCGASRPGHFRGVATIVCKLFNIVQPDVAVFGRKDYQQLMVISAMVEDLSLPIDIIGIDTVREASGLAMSSRNGFLSAEQKVKATAIKRAMDYIAEQVCAGDSITECIEKAQQQLVEAGFTMDFLAVRNASTLALPRTKDRHLVILIAAFIGKTRLIDNLTFSR